MGAHCGIDAEDLVNHDDCGVWAGACAGRRGGDYAFEFWGDLDFLQGDGWGHDFRVRLFIVMAWE